MRTHGIIKLIEVVRIDTSSESIKMPLVCIVERPSRYGFEIPYILWVVLLGHAAEQGRENGLADISVRSKNLVDREVSTKKASNFGRHDNNEFLCDPPLDATRHKGGVAPKSLLLTARDCKRPSRQENTAC